MKLFLRVGKHTLQLGYITLGLLGVVGDRTKVKLTLTPRCASRSRHLVSHHNERRTSLRGVVVEASSLRAMSAAAGVVAAIASGLANGSWNVPTKSQAPRCLHAGEVWKWENIWFLFNAMLPFINTAFVVAVVGAETLGTIYDNAESSELWAICASSLLWGFGGVGFGQAVKRCGIALGTSICMAVIIALGTALPAIVEAENLTTAQAVGTSVGASLGIVGFALGAKAGLIRDAGAAAEAEAEAEAKAKILSVEDVEDAAAAAAPAPAGAANDGVSISEVGVHAGGEMQVTSGAATTTADAAATRRRIFAADIAWCLLGGVLSSMLQFAFVFGGGLVDVARDAGVSKVAAAMPIWLLCFLGNAFGHLAYSCAELTSNDAWGLFASADRKTTAKSSALCVAMAVGMPFHIHTYGIAAVLMGDAGAVFAWPVVMSSTVFTAQLWSVFLREWDGAPREAIRCNAASLVVLVSSVLVVSVCSFY